LPLLGGKGSAVLGKLSPSQQWTTNMGSLTSSDLSCRSKLGRTLCQNAALWIKVSVGENGKIETKTK